MIQQNKQTIGDLDCIVVKDPTCESPKAAAILCHGFGAPGNDLVSLAREFMEIAGPQQEVVYIFPSAPIEMDPLFDARAWWMIDIEKIQQLMMDGQTREMQGESPELLPERRASLTLLIDHCRVDYALPASKIIVGGFSQGSMLATDVALHYPEPLGGLIVWSGALINASVWTRLAKDQSALDVVQSHGRMDPILPIAGGEDLRDMLTREKHRVRYVEFAGQHAIPMEAIELAGQLIGEVAGNGAS
jgi:phospholipase/carboxylesterase